MYLHIQYYIILQKLYRKYRCFQVYEIYVYIVLKVSLTFYTKFIEKTHDYSECKFVHIK